MAGISMQGRYDLHCHSGPSLFERLYDDFDLARRAAALGFAGVAVKDHFESTVGRAYHATRAAGGAHVYGGVVLNRYVGGINPSVVEAALAMGGRIIWMPSLDAANHVRVFGSTFRYQERGSTSRSLVGRTIEQLQHPELLTDEQGISVLENGVLSTNARAAVDIARAYDAVIATAHISKEETVALLRYASSIGGVKVLVTHPEFKVPRFNLDDMREVVALGAKLEFCAGLSYPGVNVSTVEQIKDYVLEIGAQHCVISGDTGVTYQPAGPELVRAFLQSLHLAGLTVEQIDLMTVDNPRALLGV